jgi:hypothetical protein
MQKGQRQNNRWPFTFSSFVFNSSALITVERVYITGSTVYTKLTILNLQICTRLFLTIRFHFTINQITA